MFYYLGKVDTFVRRNCTINQPCDIGEGNCILDTECKNDLTCGDKNCPFNKILPDTTEGKRYDKADNCCFRAKGTVPTGTHMAIDFTILNYT